MMNLACLSLQSEQGEDVENKLRIDENDVEEHQILKFDKADESSRRLVVHSME